MSTRVRFVSAVPAMCWDPIHSRLLSSIVAVDSMGRVWQMLSADGPGPWAEVPRPDAPTPAKRNRQSVKRRPIR